MLYETTDETRLYDVRV